MRAVNETAEDFENPKTPKLGTTRLQLSLARSGDGIAILNSSNFFLGYQVKCGLQSSRVSAYPPDPA